MSTKNTEKVGSGEKNVNRRELIQRVAAGGAVLSLATLPEKWTKPVIDAIVVPAHAQGVSGPSPSSGAGGSPTPSASPSSSPTPTPSPSAPAPSAST